MAFPDVDLLDRLGKCFPDWADRIRPNPPQIRWHGRWWNIEDARPKADGVLLQIEGGNRVKLAYDRADPLRQQWRRESAHKILRDNPGFQLRTIHYRTDRVRRHSGAFLRLLLERGCRARAVLVADTAASMENRDRLLTDLVLWWDQLALPCGHADARVYVPAGWHDELSRSLQHLTIPASCHLLDQPDSGIQAGGVDPARGEAAGSWLSPVTTVLPDLSSLPPELELMAERFPVLQLQPRKGNWELSYRGLSLAWGETGGRVRVYPGRLVTGLGEAFGWLESLVRKAVAERRFPGGCVSGFYRPNPERWLESLVVTNLKSLIPNSEGPVYAQVPTYLEGSRKVLDLLTVDRTGRLLILELKVEKELGVVFQALDYWRRVRLHLARGDFTRRGYFPGRRLTPENPRIVLVAPLFEFHPVFPILRRHLKDEVGFECIGLSSDWRRNFRVLDRFRF